MFETLGHIYQGYRAAQDSGIWFVSQYYTSAMQHYAEQWLITRNLL